MANLDDISMNKLHKFDLPNADEYIYAINNIQMATTGFINAMESNKFFAEACQMIINAIRLYQDGYFDCAFYSLRQSIELSIGTIFLNANPDKYKNWNKLEKGFESGYMAHYLAENEPSFKEVREKLWDYFDNLHELKKQIDKYVHKQGYKSFHISFQRVYGDLLIQKEKVLLNFFEKSLRACIGAVAIYRLIIDPMPLALSDENLMMRSGDFITEPYSIKFITEYIGEDIVDKLKTTQAYSDIESWLLANEKQNPTTFTLIHYQGFNRADYLELSSQLHLCSFYDRIAVGLFMCSTKISQVFLDGFFWYWSEVKSNHMGGIAMGASYYENLFNEACGDYNLPYENVFLSRFSLLENMHYVEHNAKLTEEEISAIKVLFEEFSKSYKKSQEQINDLLKSLNINEL